MQKPKHGLLSINLRRFKRGIWIAASIQAINVAGGSVYFPFLPLYLYQEHHLSMSLVGSIILVAGLSMALFQIVGGTLADRFGHRRALIVYQILAILFNAIWAVLIMINANIWSIIALAIVGAMVTGMAFPTIPAIIADISSEERLPESYALLAIGANAGWAIGPLIGGYLLHFTSYAWLLVTTALIQCLSLIIAFFIPAEPAHRNPQGLYFPNFRVIAVNFTFLAFCVLSILFFLNMGQWGSTLSVYMVDRIGFAPEQYGLLMTISGILIIIFQFPIARRIEKLGIARALFLGSFFYGAGFLSLSWIKSFTQAVGSIAIMVAGEMLFIPTAMTVVGKTSRAENRGRYMGFFGLSETLGTSIGPLLGGFLLDTFPDSSFFIWGPIALASFVAAFGFIIWERYQFR